MLQFFQRGDDSRAWTERPAAAGRHAVPAHPARPLPRQLPGARRRAGDPAGLRGLGPPHRVLRRRDRAHHPLRRAARRGRSRSSTGSPSIPRPTTSPPRTRLERAIDGIRVELGVRLAELEAEGKLLERQRLEQRTRFDLEMLKEIGYCHGIENYSRHLSGRAPGEPPPTLFDYFPRRPPAGGRREPPDHPAGARHVPSATARASRRWSTTASACPRRSTTGRSPSTSSTPGWGSASTSRRRRPPGSWSAPAASSSSRSSGPPACSTRSSRSGRPRGRWTTSWARSARS